MARFAKSRIRFRKPIRRNPTLAKAQDDDKPICQKAIDASIALRRYGDILIEHYILNPPNSHSKIDSLIKAQSMLRSAARPSITAFDLARIRLYSTYYASTHFYPSGIKKVLISM